MSGVILGHSKIHKAKNKQKTHLMGQILSPAGSIKAIHGAKVRLSKKQSQLKNKKIVGEPKPSLRESTK